MVDASGIDLGINGFFGFLHSIFEAIRNALVPTGYMNLILLAAGLGAGFYLTRRYPVMNPRLVWLWYGLLIFLAIRFMKIKTS